ncbi:MAG: diguanylate cyclase [Alphaproteobacteria bacterium]|nr:diguanylate cyclase [Alphaproteobacteria bacterium]
MTEDNNSKKSIVIDLSQAPIIFDYINNGVTITDKISTILYTNSAFTRITGYSQEEAKGDNPGMLHSGRHDKKFYENMWAQIINQGFWEGEIWNRRKSGEIYPEYLTISKVPQENENEFLYIAIFSDITFLKEDIDKKLHLAFFDPLTKLPNRNLYLDRVRQSTENTKRTTGKLVAVFYMDLDKFKSVNDTYGHYVGDELLNFVGMRLSSIVRKGDTIARIGGDEFTVILTNIHDKQSASHFAERIIEAIERPFIIEGHKIEISISIGISFYPDDTDNIDVLLANADEAMYKAKKTGAKIITHDEMKE